VHEVLALQKGGKVAFYGPPGEVLGYFNVGSWPEVFKILDNGKRDLATEFRDSAFAGAPVSGAGQPQAWCTEAPDADSARPPHWLRQAATLTSRYARLARADWRYLAGMALLPLVVGLLIRFFPLAQGLAGRPGTNVYAQEVLEIMATCACLAGTASSVRELVKERGIYDREHAVGLSPGGYLLSKALLLTVLAFTQSAVVVLLGMAGRPLPAHGLVLTASPLLELILATAGLAVASAYLGLLVSALVGTAEEAMQWLVVLTMAQVTLSGGLLPLAGQKALNWLSQAIPARWGFAAMAATVNLNQLNPRHPGSGGTDPMWAAHPAGWWHAMAWTLAIGTGCLMLTWLQLRRLQDRRG
jgi:hypothetical protein